MSDLRALIAAVEEQERELTFLRMDYDLAWQLGLHLREAALHAGHAVVVDVALGGQVVFHCGLPGTARHNDRWVERKKATVREWRASSYAVGLRFPLLDPPHALETAPWMDAARYSGSGGGFPIAVDHAGLVGTIAVSGLRHDLDHAFVVASLRTFGQRRAV